MGEEREAVCLHTICWHIPHSIWFLCSVLIYTCSMMFSFPSHTPLFWWDSPPCSGLSWEWGNGSVLPIFLCYTEVRTFSWWSYVGPLLTHTRQTFSLSLLIPKSLNQKKTKDDSSALRFCRIGWPSSRSDWERQDTYHVSLLPSSPLLPPTSLSLFPLIPPCQICLGWQRGVRVRRQSNLGNPLFLESKNQDSEKRKPGEDSFFLLSVNTYFPWSISIECPRLRVKARS